MKIQTRAIALTLGLLGTLAATPSHAYVYADSRLLLQNLTLVISPNPPAARNFTFTATNSATMDNQSQFFTAQCSGGPGAAGVANDCSSTLPRLNPQAANAPGSGVTRGNTDFTFKGPAGALNFSNAASTIDTSNLTNDPNTAIRQIAESELSSNRSASANADIQSVTGFTFSFTLTAPGQLALDFQANPDLFVAISEAFNGLFSAQSTMQASFTLQQDGTTSFAKWSPDGSGLDCQTSGGFTCLVRDDQGNLNQTIGVTTNGTSAASSHDGDGVFGLFGVTIGNLGTGSYTLTLASNTKTQLNRLVVPEPESLLLLGIGAAGLGLATRRRQKKQAA